MNVGAVLFGQARQAVLRMLLGCPGERFYQRQIIRTAGTGSGAIQRELEQLTAAGILLRTVEGRQTYYQANRDCVVFAELQGLIRKTFGVADVLRSGLATLAPRIRLAFVFGSMAEGRERAASDVDLMIIADKLSTREVVEALAECQRELGREVNPSLYGTEELRRALRGGRHFLTEVFRKGEKLFVIGDEGTLAAMARERVAEGASVQPRRNRRSPGGRRTRLGRGEDAGPSP